MNLKNKFTSRKFIACLAGVATGIGVILRGSTIEGVVVVIAAVATYICAEAGIDKAAVKNTLEGVADKLDDEEDIIVTGFDESEDK